MNPERDTSQVEEDYLRLIWKAEEWGSDSIGTTQLAAALGTAPSSVSGALTRLTKRGLIEHESYGQTRLTDAGRAVAVAMVRRHRLLETFLVEHFHYDWDEVHEEAELLEHAVSDRLLDLIDDELGNPDRDPHGDPIPSRTGEIVQNVGRRLGEIAAGTTATVVRVSDHDPALLRYLASIHLVPGRALRVVEVRDYAGSLAIEIDGAPHDLALVAANSVWADAG